MLTTETKEKLQSLGFDVSRLEEAIKSESEETLEVPTLYKEQGLSEEDKITFGNNRFEEGKKAMSEIKAKEFKALHGIEMDGKDLDKVISAIVDKKVKENSGDPDKRVETLNEEKKTLQDMVTQLEDEKKGLINKHSNELFNLEAKQSVKSSLPKDGLIISHEDITDLFFKSYGVAQDDQGRTIVKKGEEVLKTSTLEPLPLKDVVTSFIEERKYVSKNGMGGNDGARSPSGTKKFSNMQEFMDWAEANDVPPMSTEGQKVLKDNKTEDFKY